MSKPTTEELIERLDPDRNYGDRTFEQVVQEVRDGDLLLREAPNDNVLPIIYSKSGPIVKGTASTSHPGANAASQKLTNRLLKFVADGADDLAIGVLREALEGGTGDDKVPWKTRLDAVELLFLRVLGVPERQHTPNESAALLALIERIASGDMGEERDIPQLPAYTTLEVEAE
ncbi:hypothetical protein LCGC14_1198800 [marine sediment metagenome]|uniref:Uncharacterized protein n=1 Tax=marine sediment metagenome TaxID=412755 RepID=A0A0F9PMB4_9ZZZZ